MAIPWKDTAPSVTLQIDSVDDALNSDLTGFEYKRLVMQMLDVLMQRLDSQGRKLVTDESQRILDEVAFELQRDLFDKVTY